MKMTPLEQLKTHKEGRTKATAALELVAEEYGFDIKDLLGKKRTQPLALARQIAMALVHDTTGWPLTLIGDQFGRDHTTVMWAIRKVRRCCYDDSEFHADYRNLKDHLE